ncbi:hypothetical protein [Archaeoglobus sp.]
MIKLIEPLKKLIVDGLGVNGEEVEEQLFGGFCECGGVMYQRFWFTKDSEKILVSECEKCWKHKAMIFNSHSFVSRQNVDVLGKYDFIEFLKETLGSREFETLVKKAKNEDFDPISYSKAKKLLASMNLDVEEVLEQVQ